MKIYIIIYLITQYQNVYFIPCHTKYSVTQTLILYNRLQYSPFEFIYFTLHQSPTKTTLGMKLHALLKIQYEVFWSF